MSAEIYENLFAQCGGATFADRWRFVRPEENCRLLPCDGASLLISLSEEFEAEDLLEARVAVRTDDREVRLNPKLNTTDRWLIVLRNANGQACDILSSSGTLNEQVPVLAARTDMALQNRMASSRGTLFVTSSLVDAALLRSLGLPAAVATYMDRLAASGLQRLLSMADEFSNSSDYIHLVLMGCELATGALEMPPKMAAVASCCAQAKRYLELPGLAISVWWPTGEDWNNLEFRRRAGSIKLVGDFLKSDRCLHDVEAFLDPSQPPPREPGYVQRLEQLLAAEANCRQHPNSLWDNERLRQAIAAYDQQLQRWIVDPLTRIALKTRDPSLRAVRLQLAHASAVLHRMLPNVHNAQARSAEAGGIGLIDFMSEASWKRFEMLMDRTTKLAREEARLRKIIAGL